jgi:hypothetical protein
MSAREVIMRLDTLLSLPFLGLVLAASRQEHSYTFNTNNVDLTTCNSLFTDNSTNARPASHVTGVITAQNLAVGPDTGSAPSSPGVWTLNIPSNPVADTKYLLLHFTSVSLPGNNRIEVALGYDTDIFHVVDGISFWTRPINTKKLAGAPVVVRYFTDGATTGVARIDHLGIGERHAGEQDPTSFSNCDPFFTDAVYPEPKYDPFWYCNNPPQWENAACVADPNDIRAKVARSAGMIIIADTTENLLSTCSVTLIDVDQVIFAGHCFHSDEDVLGASVTFDYATDCAGNRLPGYNPVFYKAKQVLNHRWDPSNPGAGDWTRVKLATPVVGVPPLQLRPNLPAVGEQVFGIHHPNGAVKKISLMHNSFATVVTSSPNAIQVPLNFHVSGGSSGSCLFDMAGRCVGVLSLGSPCSGFNLRYFPTASMLTDFAPTLPDPVTKDVMVVFDRSGSMFEKDSTGRAKIEVARDAVSLFIQLVRANVGNRVGLVSFSTAAAVDLGLSVLDTASKSTLIGSSPFSGGKVGALTPSGSTSIGGGLEKARLQLPAGAPGSNPRVILLLTDGMENTAPSIDSVASNLGDITVHAIGFGTNANLDGAKLSALANTHAGLYTRASSGVSLQKFFSQAFGNIFETGILSDPELTLPAGVDFAPPRPVSICKEDAVTVAVGWDDTTARLGVNLTTPSGIVIGSRSPNVEAADGRSWTYLRVPLPYNSEQTGQWNATVFRIIQTNTTIPRFLRRLIRAVSPSPPLQYFVNVIPTGGPRLRKAYDTTTYYTGDTVNPSVVFSFLDNSWISEATVEVTLSRPNASAGTLLSQTGLQTPMTVMGDTIPARQVSLARIDSQIGLVDEVFQLGNDAASTGAFETTGLFGKFLVDRLRVEGEYQFHFKAATTAASGGGCVYNREILWSLHVEIGVEPDTTTSTTTLTGPGTGVVVVTPRDKYNNSLGPGRSDTVTFSGGPGTTVTGPVVDNGDGSYTIPIAWTGTGSNNPVVVITQPGRNPVEVKVPVSGGDGSGSCTRCSPHPGQNKCHITTSCSVAGPDLGTMCACRPGYKAVAGRSDVQWRVDWSVPGHEHRVYVTPGQECGVLCDEWYLGADGCKEVAVKAC